MPRGNGTGPRGQGPRTGRGMGGRGFGQGSGGNGMGSKGLGTSGDCVCPSCGTKISHQTGVPCYEVNCPKCSAKMTRE